MVGWGKDGSMIKDFEVQDVYLLSGLCFFASGHWICGIVCIVTSLSGAEASYKRRNVK